MPGSSIERNLAERSPPFSSPPLRPPRPRCSRGGNDPAIAADRHFPGWPTHYEGRALTELALTQRELAFVRDFPGRVGRFSDGSREIIIRWIGAPTRRLHPAADCFRGLGYSVTPLPVGKDATGAAMGCFRASHGADHLTVCEVIRDQRGGSWPDVSAWYWDGLLGASCGAVVVVRGGGERVTITAPRSCAWGWAPAPTATASARRGSRPARPARRPT